MFSNKSNNNNIIFVDIDDTICDTRKAFVELYCEITGNEPGNINSRHYRDMCPGWTDENEISSMFKYGNDIYKRAVPIEGAKEGITKLLKKGFKIKLVSLNYADSVGAKQRWVEKYFPELKDDVVILTTINTNKDIFQGHAIIDDDYKNIKTNPSNYPILLDTYKIYNDLDYYYKHNSWKEIVDKF